VRTFCLEHGSRRPQIAYGGWYDPTTGTFLTRDPLDGINGTTVVANPYHYTDKDPVNQTDPSGLSTRFSAANWAAPRVGIDCILGPVFCIRGWAVASQAQEIIGEIEADPEMKECEFELEPLGIHGSCNLYLSEETTVAAYNYLRWSVLYEDIGVEDIRSLACKSRANAAITVAAVARSISRREIDNMGENAFSRQASGLINGSRTWFSETIESKVLSKPKFKTYLGISTCFGVLSTLRGTNSNLLATATAAVNSYIGTRLAFPSGLFLTSPDGEVGCLRTKIRFGGRLEFGGVQAGMALDFEHVGWDHPFCRKDSGR